MSDQPTVDIIDVTPEMAAQYLDANVLNRRPKDHKVTQYARDMVAGNWRMTGEALKFDGAGNLLDGQNRCMAILRAGVPVRMMVVRGIEPEAQVVMDSGARRSNADALAFNGFQNVTVLTAAVNTHSAWVSGDYRHCMVSHGTPGTRKTHQESVDYILAHEGIEYAAELTVKVRHAIPLATGAICAVAYELGVRDEPARDEFFARIDEFRTNGKGDPIRTLLRRVADMKDRGDVARVRAAMGVYLLVRTWNAWRTDETLTRLLTGSERTGWATIPNVV